MKRIWTKEELEKADFGMFDEDGDFKYCKFDSRINSKMLGKSVEWCLDNGFTVKYWMIAKPTQQEPKEGDFVYVWSGEERPTSPRKRIFITKIKYGCVCVSDGYEDYYKKGEYFSCTIWKNYEPIPKLTSQEIAEKVGLTVEELRSIVNG